MRSGFLSDNVLFCNQWSSAVLFWEGITLEERFPHLSSDTQMGITAIRNAQLFTFGDSNNESSSVAIQSSRNKNQLSQDLQDQLTSSTKEKVICSWRKNHRKDHLDGVSLVPQIQHDGE